MHELESEPTFEEWLEGIRGVKELKRLHEDAHDDLIEWSKDTWDLIGSLGVDVERHSQAERLLEVLLPTKVDGDLWEAIALGKNVHLAPGQQTGTGPMQTAAAARRTRTRGNDYGKIHDKKDPTSQFIERQGKAAVRAAAKVKRLEEELEAARTEQANLDNGLRAFAATCLLTQMRKATSSMFAMGPAWTILRAIAGTVGDEISDTDRRRQSQFVLVVLHAMSGNLAFEQELKGAIRKICRRYEGEARARGQVGSELDGPIEYAAILDELAWPDEETLKRLGPLTRYLSERDADASTRRLLEIATSDGPFARKATEFLLAWWKGDQRSFHLRNLIDLPLDILNDMITVMVLMRDTRWLEPDIFIDEGLLVRLQELYPAQ